MKIKAWVCALALAAVAIPLGTIVHSTGKFLAANFDGSRPIPTWSEGNNPMPPWLAQA